MSSRLRNWLFASSLTCCRLSDVSVSIASSAWLTEARSASIWDSAACWSASLMPDFMTRWRTLATLFSATWRFASMISSKRIAAVSIS